MELHLRRNVRAWSLAGAAWLLFQAPLPASAGTAPPLLEFDFTRPAVAAQWRALHDIRRLEAAPDGLRVEIAGGDPYLARIRSASPCAAEDGGNERGFPSRLWARGRDCASIPQAGRATSA